MLKKYLVKLYHKLSDFAIVRFAAAVYYHGMPWGNFLAYRRLKRTAEQLRQEKFDKINVVFLCQNVQVWGKVRPVFELLLEDERFQVWVIGVPDITDEPGKNDTYAFLRELGYPESSVIDAGQEGSWFDLLSLHPYYVFYSKSYDQYLPEEYRSKTVSAYAKNCYILYGLTTIAIEDPHSYSRIFFRNIAIYFAENKYRAAFNRKRMAWSHRNGVRRSLSLGYPAFEVISREVKTEEHGLPLRTLWTPRWSEDKEVGGSNFLKYKDRMPEFIEAHEELSMTFRPHPLTFYHFVSIKKMTEEEVEAYKARWQGKERLFFDAAPDYLNQFSWSDVLVSDTSSMIIEYAVTGKPVIFCDTGCKNNRDMDRLMDGFYVAHSLEEVEDYLLMLSRGEDPLREKREKICREMFGKNILKSSKRIVEALACDFYNCR